MGKRRKVYDLGKAYFDLLGSRSGDVSKVYRVKARTRYHLSKKT